MYCDGNTFCCCVLRSKPPGILTRKPLNYEFERRRHTNCRTWFLYTTKEKPEKLGYFHVQAVFGANTKSFRKFDSNQKIPLGAKNWSLCKCFTRRNYLRKSFLLLHVMYVSPRRKMNMIILVMQWRFKTCNTITLMEWLGAPWEINKTNHSTYAYEHKNCKLFSMVH